MKNIKLTCFVVAMALISLLVGFVIFSGGMQSYALTDDYEKIANVDPLVTNLQNILISSDELRVASLVADDVSDEMMLKHILLSLTKEDYSVSFIRPTKIMCYVTKDVFFVSENKCEIRKIKNEKIMEYQKKLFNTSKELIYAEIDYHGMHCKNNGENYYCHIRKYIDETKSFSLIDKVYKKGDKIYLYEYYMLINLNDYDKCLKYFEKDYCADYTNKETVELSSDVVKNNGVYYKHVFQKNDIGGYSLYSSDVIVG